MGLLELLRHYFATTPREDIRKDWERTKEYDETGVTVSELLRYWRKTNKINQIKKNKKKMKNLLNCNGRFFSAKIYKDEVTGRIRVEDKRVFLCQDKKSGVSCKNRLGYKYSWEVRDGSEEELINEHVYDFKLTSLTAEEIEQYKDWQEGDVLELLDEHEKDFDERHEVIFRSGELVVLKNKDGEASENYTCDQLYKYGYRLFQPEMEEEKITELTMDEIAEKFGLPIDKIRVKKD